MPLATIPCTVTIDEKLGVGYIKLTREAIVRSKPAMDDALVFDYDEHDRVVGIEILSMKRIRELAFTNGAHNGALDATALEKLLPRLLTFS